MLRFLSHSNPKKYSMLYDPMQTESREYRSAAVPPNVPRQRNRP